MNAKQQLIDLIERLVPDGAKYAEATFTFDAGTNAPVAPKDGSVRSLNYTVEAMDRFVLGERKDVPTDRVVIGGECCVETNKLFGRSS